MKINLNEKKFKSLSNTSNGEVSLETTFHYRQNGSIVWATYEGGDILFGTLSGSIIDNEITFNYQHQNINGEFLTGKCQTSVQVVENKIQLYERWQWTCKDYSKGKSVLVEINQ